MVQLRSSCESAVFDYHVATLVDGKNMGRFLGPSALCVDKADSLSMTVAAASIIAKVDRDAYMSQASKKFPEYGFDRNKGYPTPQHLKALELHGPCKIHRRTFGPVKKFEIFD